MTGPTTTTTDIEEAKRRARAELEGYRERKRLEREAKAKAEQTADDEIAQRVRSERAEREHREWLDAERRKFWAERERKNAEANAAYLEERRRAGTPTINTDTPGRLAARMLRRRLGDDFDAFVADLMRIDLKQLKIELARVPVDERNETLARHHAELTAQRLAEAATLPEPECEEEREILQRHGFAA